MALRTDSSGWGAGPIVCQGTEFNLNLENPPHAEHSKDRLPFYPNFCWPAIPQVMWNHPAVRFRLCHSDSIAHCPTLQHQSLRCCGTVISSPQHPHYWHIKHGFTRCRMSWGKENICLVPRSLGSPSFDLLSAWQSCHIIMGWTKVLFRFLLAQWTYSA